MMHQKDTELSIDSIEERLGALEKWMANTRRVHDPSIFEMDRHVAGHIREASIIRQLEKELGTLIKEVSEIRASLIALCSAREVHNLIDELKE